MVKGVVFQQRSAEIQAGSAHLSVLLLSDQTAEFHSLRAAVFASRFTSNLCGQNVRGPTSLKSLLKVSKPKDLDFSDPDSDRFGHKIK
ncbi:hypothetical protein V6N13_098509 [Hibiscus sabdariffa]